MIKSTLAIVICLCTISLLFSCGTTKSATYFNDMHDSSMLVKIANLEPIIHKNDLLSITVSSSNPELTQVFNVQNSSSQVAGYLVSQDGAIEFPLIGKINVDGTTKKQLKQAITQALIEKQLVRDPIVDVRYLNYRVSILGEVAHPSVINVPSEKISVLEAISLAGDLTLTAKRDNVMLIRDEEGRKIFQRLNLNSSALFQSPYYYLRSNDILYIEPNRTKIASSSRFNLVFPVVISTLSLGLLVVDRITR